MKTTEKIKDIASVDPLKQGKQPELFVGHPFSLDYNKANILVCDDDKEKVKGIAQGTFLLAFYDNEETVEEAILLRALAPAKLPTDSSMISSMIEYYKDNLPTSGKNSKLDNFTRYEFSFSGLECRVLGTFYRNGKIVEFGADLENFYSAHHYSVYKVNKDVLGFIVNQRDSPDITPGNDNEFSIGHVRYSSSLRFQNDNEKDKAEVYIHPADLLGKRTALFGMTRTGKSNTVKKVIEATVQISSKATKELSEIKTENIEEFLKSFESEGAPKFPVGQIIFDINGEYANANLQDGNSISDRYDGDVTKYSVLKKEGFTVMKVNFFKQIQSGFELVKSFLYDETGDYVKSFLAIDLTEPEVTDKSAYIRWERKVAAYLCCLHAAKFPLPTDMNSIKFSGNDELNRLVKSDGSLVPDKGISFDDAINWLTIIWENYNSHKHFSDYKSKKGREWADEDLKALLVFLTRKRNPAGAANVSGYQKLRGIVEQHTNTGVKAFEEEIIEKLRQGKIIIIDLSQGNPKIQELYSEILCQKIFNHSMNRFINNLPNNFIQFYFEEAHNLFPKKDDKDLSIIYNRIAKEGAKLNLGMIYATQEVSSISSNILKNTQNWFIAHLNNEDEIRELRKYYDFDDFADSLIRFSAKNDKGFVRMKTYSNPFIVPVQIDKFSVVTSSK
ncbi:ATP-binding protein [Elizabethkingia anophelis]|nr:ATP-binding protein [Elizabethkingia anophelis]MCT4261419.1 ATP-binding protein [Elizabethkingia anophelis]